MTTPPIDLASIPQLKDIKIVNKTNIGESKFSIGVLGDAKQGKTHFWCTFPPPIVCYHLDPNTETADGFIASGVDISLLLPPSSKGKDRIEDWNFFADVFVPLVQNRMLPAATVVVEGYNYLADALVRKMQAGRAEITWPTWGQIKNMHLDRLVALKSATVPADGKPSYHLVVTSHMVETGDEGSQKYAPDIQGGFKFGFAKVFGSVFIAQSKAKHDIVAGIHQVVGKENFLYTVPPSEKYACGDGVGGKGNRKALPPKVENTYQALCAAWGIKE